MKQLILNEYKANATEEYLEEQMNRFDENNDGQFDFEEIVEAITFISAEVIAESE
jgi:Ca2+-binding EF-hand superfamily protein